MSIWEDHANNCGSTLKCYPISITFQKSNHFSGAIAHIKKTKHCFIPRRYEDFLKNGSLEGIKRLESNVYGHVNLGFFDDGLNKSRYADLAWRLSRSVEAEGRWKWLVCLGLRRPIAVLCYLLPRMGSSWKQDWEPYWKNENTKWYISIGKIICFSMLYFFADILSTRRLYSPDNVALPMKFF